MVETQVTTMVIKVVDLGCEKCRKKIKKLLCKIPLPCMSCFYYQRKWLSFVDLMALMNNRNPEPDLCRGEKHSDNHCGVLLS
ncbi:hypothetical protein SADUNF_Sadunf06G0013500 [Salix dunnii]|uniref:HMA domain-containing protein n=1 Tax=Salix dunnii TaxID=1413687 RepID=A0A835K2H9_9ROSI|nr:hypothetical protein SADUNF_Sadunf06G0013500 [Salix dunnii]